MVKVGAVRGAALVACLLAGAACGRIEDDGIDVNAGRSKRHTGAGEAADRASGRLYLGRWNGTTSQGLSFAFTVDDGDPDAGVTAITYAWQLPSCSYHEEIHFDDPMPIRDGAMAVQVEAPGSVLDVALAFDDATSAHGTLTFAAARPPSAPGCTGSGAVPFVVARRPGD
jgi:hypothetical protein